MWILSIFGHRGATGTHYHFEESSIEHPRLFLASSPQLTLRTNSYSIFQSILWMYSDILLSNSTSVYFIDLTILRQYFYFKIPFNILANIYHFSKNFQTYISRCEYYSFYITIWIFTKFIWALQDAQILCGGLLLLLSGFLLARSSFKIACNKNSSVIFVYNCEYKLKSATTAQFCI